MLTAPMLLQSTGNGVVSALGQVFGAFQEQEQLRQGQGPAALEPLLAVDPAPLREALARLGAQRKGDPQQALLELPHLAQGL